MANLRSVVRFDSMPVPRAYFTPEGYLKDRPILTSCGIFEYTNPDGSTRRELRLPEDVFSPDSLRSYRGKPICISHEAGLIDKNNVAKNQIGTILSEGERSGGDVVAEIIIHDTDAMRTAGLKELSLGYNLDLDETPGVWNGQRFDARQRNIRINHLALVREARAGEQARLNLDGRDCENVLKGGRRMSKKIKGVPHADAVLSDEELDKALEEYDKKYGNKQPEAQTDADEPEEEVVEKEETVVEPAPSDDVEEKVEMVKARRDKRDEEGDPEDVDAAMGMIAHQDEDIDSLLDIIDTLRAKLDFSTAKDADDEPVVEEEQVVEEEKPEEEVEEDSFDKLNKLKENTSADAADEELPEEEEEDLELNADDEELPEDEEEENFEEDGLVGEAIGSAIGTALGNKASRKNEDADEEEEDFPEEEEEDFEQDGDDCGYGEKRMNADSVDRLVNQKIALGELGEKVGLKGLARKPVKDAKKAIIRAVNPKIRLDGKSDTYLNATFKMARDVIRARSVKTTADQKKQMFNKDSADKKREVGCSATAARERMIARQSNKSN